MRGTYTIQIYLGSGEAAEKIIRRIDKARGPVGVSAFVRRAIEAELSRIESRADDEIPQ